MGVFDAVCGALFVAYWGYQLWKDKKVIQEEKRVEAVKRWYLANKKAEKLNSAKCIMPLQQWMVNEGYLKIVWDDGGYVIQTPFGELGREICQYI